MTILSWNDQYLIGQSTIDEQHKVLFELVNDFHSHWKEKRDRQQVAFVLNKLIQYGERHFRDEEAIMTREGYPLLESHHKIHELLIEEVFKLNEELISKNPLLERDMTKFLKQWLVEHIVTNDYEFRNFLARKQRDAAPG